MNKYLKTAYQFGALGGVLSVASFIFLSFWNTDPTNLNLIFGYLITPIALFLGIKFFKEYNNGGYLSFAEGMTVGFVTYLLIGVISSLGIVLFLTVSPELFSSIQDSKWSVLEENREVIIAQVGLDSFELTQSNLKKISVWDIALNDGIWKIIPGLFFSIIISIILRKNPN
jgi:hypothetical protein